MLGHGSGNHDWRLRFLRFSFTQRTQRKRLRLDGNRALEKLTATDQVISALDSFTIYYYFYFYFDVLIINKHYASISTDPDYRPPSCNLTARPTSNEYITEWQVFRALERRRPTATGLDALPSWFLKLCLLYTSPSPRD